MHLTLPLQYAKYYFPTGFIYRMISLFCNWSMIYLWEIWKLLKPINYSYVRYLKRNWTDSIKSQILCVYTCIYMKYIYVIISDLFLLTYRYKWVPWLSSCTSICFIYYHKTSIFAMYIIFCWCFGIHHIKEKLWTLIKLISTCANYIVDVIKYLTYDCIALRRSSHRSPTQPLNSNKIYF